MKRLLHTDEQREAVSELERTADALEAACLDEYECKYVVLHLYAALQAFMVFALRGSAGLEILSKKPAAAWLKAYADLHKGGTPTWPREFMAVPLELYERIQSPWMDRFTHSRRFAPTARQTESVRALVRLRHRFMHFVPAIWTIDLRGLPDVVEDCLEVISFLGWESGNVYWHDDGYAARALEAVSRCQDWIRLLNTALSEED